MKLVNQHLDEENEMMMVDATGLLLTHAIRFDKVFSERYGFIARSYSWQREPLSWCERHKSRKFSILGHQFATVISVKSFAPHPILHGVVKRITVFRFVTDSDNGPINPFPPLPDQCLYFYPFDRVTTYNYATDLKANQPASMIVGPQTKRVDLQLGRDMLVIIVAFYAGGLYRLIRVPMHETLNISLNAKDFFPKGDIDDVQDQLCHANSFETMNAAVQHFLIKRSSAIKGDLPVDRAIVQLLEQDTHYTVNTLAGYSCLSTRQLERQFLERVGMSPKIFLRLVRFSKAWVARERDSSLSWIQIANAFGYADQMHMIRDFRQFASVNPGSIEKDLYSSPLRLQADLHR